MQSYNTGSDARNGDVHDDVHAAGGQLGLTDVPRYASLNFNGFYEFAAADRFQGQACGISLVKKF